MNATTSTSKTFANTFLYGKYSEYESKLFNFIMNGHQINKDGEGFDDIKYEIKKHQISNSLVKVLNSDNVILTIAEKPLPKSFKVFAAKDIKSDKKLKVFIDCTGIISNVDGKYICTNNSILTAYLVSAMNTLIYYADNKRIVMNNSILSDGANCFSLLFTYVVDYIYKISTVSNIRDKCLYLSSIYYLTNILGKDFDNESTRAIAKKISGLSEREEEIIKLQLEENSFLNIKYFLETASNILKLDRLSLDLFVEKWMYLYGPGTVFGLELYPSFASMITDSYVGCYLNNQKTIEKITGKYIVDFTKTILSIGADSI